MSATTELLCAFVYVSVSRVSWSVCVSVCQLLDLQLSDSNFRRYILLQYLILFHYLNAQVRFKTSVLRSSLSHWTASNS